MEITLNRTEVGIELNALAVKAHEPDKAGHPACFDPLSQPRHGGAIQPDSEPAPGAPTMPGTPSSRSAAPVALGAKLAAGLLKQWRRFRARLRDCKSGLTEEAVHELRVSSRRLSAQLELVADALPKRKVKWTRRRLKACLAVLSDLRDTQVQIEAVASRKKVFPALSPLWRDLRQREARLKKIAEPEIQRVKTGKLGRRIKRFARRLRKTDPIALEGILRGALTRAFEAVDARRRRIRRHKPATIHATRVAFKRFRYMVEAMPREVLEIPTDQFAAMARHQKVMGAVQDADVFLARLRRHVNEDRLEARALHGLLLSAARQRRRRINAYLEVADELYSFWPVESLFQAIP